MCPRRKLGRGLFAPWQSRDAEVKGPSWFAWAATGTLTWSATERPAASAECTSAAHAPRMGARAAAPVVGSRRTRAPLWITDTDTICSSSMSKGPSATTGQTGPCLFPPPRALTTALLSAAGAQLDPEVVTSPGGSAAAPQCAAKTAWPNPAFSAEQLLVTRGAVGYQGSASVRTVAMTMKRETMSEKMPAAALTSRTTRETRTLDSVRILAPPTCHSPLMATSCMWRGD